MNQNLRIEGFFLEFDSDEIEVIKAELKSRGYEAGSSGLKAMLMDVLNRHTGRQGAESVEETETDRLIRKTRDYIKNNPHLVKFGMDYAKKIAMKAMTRK